MPNIDLGNAPVGTPPDSAQQAQIRAAIGASPAPLTLTAPPVDGVTTAAQIGQLAQLPGDPDRWWIAETITSWREVPLDLSAKLDATASAVAAAIATNPDAVLAELTPTRLLYIEDIPGTWFNGSNTQSLAAIPLTAVQAVIGTKIRLRGFLKIGFQGTAPTLGGDALVLLTFNVAADSAVAEEGVLFVVGVGTTAVFHVDAELELKDAGGGNYKLGVTTSQVYHAHVQYLGANPIIARFWDEASSTLFLVDPTTPETIGSTAGLVVQLQTAGSLADLSLCNFWMDMTYEINTP